ncbi:MAG: GtrA family protein [Gemmiger sp.]|nr:GtrA family protein [Gemmiger sp.]
MEKLKAFIKKYYEQLSYLFFGGLATLLNLVITAVFLRTVGVEFATGIGNILDNAICILFAYWTNRTFVFKSKNSGGDGLREFGQFIACRLGTLVLDQFNLWLGVSVVGAALISAPHMELWAMGVKLVSQVIVIVANYFFSKWFIFKQKQ